MFFRHAQDIQNVVAGNHFTLFIHAQAAVRVAVVGKAHIQAVILDELLQMLDMSRAGILIDGHILHGASDIIGAIGWLALKPPYDKYWDQCGCFETHASGDGLAKQAQIFLREDKEYNGVLRNKPIEEVTSYDVFAEYPNGDPIAVRVIDQAIEMWGMAAANLVSLLNPEMVIFGGGIFGPAAPLIPRIYEEAKKWAQPISIKQTKFVATQLPKMAGLYGAGGVAIQALKQ